MLPSVPTATSASVPFPLLVDAATYDPNTFDYLQEPSGTFANQLPTYKSWIDVFRASIAPFQKRAEQDPKIPEKDRKASAAHFAHNFASILSALEADPWAVISGHGSAKLSCVRLCELREACLREAGFTDIFKEVKDEENAKALQMLPSLLRDLDAVQDAKSRLELSLKGVFAGNIFDLGATASSQLFDTAGSSFRATRESLVPRPWAIDHLDTILGRFHAGRPYHKAVLFVDNAGSDVVLGMLPFARELLQQGTQVVLAANSQPSVNDVTADELQGLVDQAAELDPILRRAVLEHCLFVVASGSKICVIDLSQVSAALAGAVQDADLVVLEGMGRAIETNLYASFKCDSLNLGMIKHPEVAALLQGRLYDCVCKSSEAAR